MGIMRRVGGFFAGGILGALGTAAGSAGVFALLQQFERGGSFLPSGPALAALAGAIFGGGVGLLAGAIVGVIRPAGGEGFVIGALLALLVCGLLFGESPRDLTLFYLLGMAVVAGCVCAGVAYLVADRRAPRGPPRRR